MQSNTLIDPIHVNHHPAEMPLFIVMVIISSLIWLTLVVTVLGLVYALFFALFFFISHLLFITHIKGSAVKLGPDQFPDLYNRVVLLSEKAGLTDIPDAYIMQAGGSLNALATKFFRSKIIILYSDLLEACGANKGARDMVIGHEIGHHKAGHLKWWWFIAPAMIIPFLGSAYSRAREFTCDRYGVALANDPKGALTGLTILSAGGKVGPHVNLHAFVNQKLDINTGFLTIGQWLSMYPPLIERVAVIDPRYVSNLPGDNSGTIKALAILSAFIILPVIIGIISLVAIVPKFQSSLQQLQTNTEYSNTSFISDGQQNHKINQDLENLVQLVNHIYRSTGELPLPSNNSLSPYWQQYRPGIPEPIDPYDGNPYGYQLTGDNSYYLWSAGPDKITNTDDDILIERSPN